MLIRICIWDCLTGTLVLIEFVLLSLLMIYAYGMSPILPPESKDVVIEPVQAPGCCSLFYQVNTHNIYAHTFMHTYIISVGNSTNIKAYKDSFINIYAE